MRRSLSLATRAVFAIGLLIAFYALAIAVSIGLLYFPYAEWRFAGRIHPRLALFCGVGALIILWSLMPRVDRFRPPGPALRRESQRRLFGVLEKVADATGQAMPAEVYLAPDMNAWVAQRGGILALGSRRVMGLGLPLLRLLSTSQLAAVLAHEFGHYYSGDTSLAPLVYKTRVSIGRTIVNLAEHSAFLMKPFEWYGALFLRVTHGISRHQEFSADQLAARTVGATPLIEGLKAVHGGAFAFELFWNTEVAPTLQSGYLPPIAQGFGEFVRAPAVSAVTNDCIKAQLSADGQDPYDTHPPLTNRIAAVETIQSDVDWNDDSPAISLLDDIEALEFELIANMAGRETAEKLERVGWPEVPARVWVPAWRSHAEEQRDRLKGITAGSLMDLASHPGGLAVAMRLAARPDVATEKHRQEASATLGAALAVALADRGFSPTSQLGMPVVVERGGLQIRPFELWDGLVSNEVNATDWADTCAQAGIASVDLGSAGGARHPVDAREALG